jgi:hypothetical protein
MKITAANDPFDQAFFNVFKLVSSELTQNMYRLIPYIQMRGADDRGKSKSKKSGNSIHNQVVIFFFYNIL